MAYYPRSAADAKYLDVAGDTMVGTLVLAGNPTNPLDAVPKQYADLISQGFSFKNAVRAVSTTNITLSGLQTIDGVALSANNRVLVTGQTAASANGIYAAASGAWTRTTDADASGEIQDGTLVPVAGGTANADTLWLCTAIGADPWIPDTNTSTWAKFAPAGSTGTTILSGTSTPTSGVGNAGDYYLDIDDQILYGPKLAASGGFGPPQSAITSQIPNGSVFFNNVSLGQDVQIAVPGRITGLRYYRYASSNRTSHDLKVWSAGGALLGTCTTSGETGSGWITATFGSPVVVTAGTYRLSVEMIGASDGMQFRSPAGANIVNGDLTLVNPGFYGSNNVKPATASTDMYFIDLSFEAGTQPPNPWPVAVSNYRVQDEGSALALRSKVNFVGAAVTATDDAANDRTIVTITGAQAPSRQTVSFTTASLAAGASESGTVMLASSYRLLSITTNAPARTRLYTTIAKRDADASRPSGTDPIGDHGLMLDFTSTASVLSADLSPMVDGYDGKATPDGIIPWAVTNTGGSLATITVTLLWIRTE